jgi:hypothetical protein
MTDTGAEAHASGHCAGSGRRPTVSGFTPPAGIPCMEHAIAGDERHGSRREDSPADPPRGGGLGGGPHVSSWATSAANVDASIAAMLMRIAVCPCQVVPPQRQVPSDWIRSITRRVRFGVPKDTSTGLSTTSLRTLWPAVASACANRCANAGPLDEIRQPRSTQVAQRRPHLDAAFAPCRCDPVAQARCHPAKSQRANVPKRAQSGADP